MARRDGNSGWMLLPARAASLDKDKLSGAECRGLNVRGPDPAVGRMW